MKKLSNIMLIVLGIIISNFSFAQKTEAFALIDTGKIIIGQQAKIDLYLNYAGPSKKINIQWPQIGDTITKQIEVVNVSKIDTIPPSKSNSGNLQQHQTIYITSFDSGYWAIPPFIFTIDNDTVNPISTQALLLEVETIPVDTAETSIKDVKPIYDEPFHWKEILPYIYWGAGIVAILALFYYIIYRRLKNRKVIPDEKPKIKIAPHIVAFRDLENIKNLKLWQEGKTKEYYTAITDTIRVYLEGRYNISAMELTSDEIMSVMKSQLIDGVSKEKLKQILALADYVKFAKAQPIDVENEITINNAFDFVKGTLREEINEENSAFNQTEQK